MATKSVKKEVLVRASIVILTTSVSASTKTKKDISSVKTMLESKNAPYIEIDASVDVDGRKKWQAISGVKTLPQVFINNKYVGDWEKLQGLEEEEALDALLEAAP
eukprot:TRINITY_DN6_c0_g1_i2.p1 TRINITY_DN6_c0_g1~~TRINITY_DN6_c0_g1_i2.p1  ORF type:complete len:105 (-),score=35.84 TRINITY_DN6_c0_g1_i2:99-413(-)